MQIHDEEERKSYADGPLPKKKKGFGLAFSGFMTFLYLLAMQVIPTLIALVVIVVIVAPKMQQGTEDGTTPDINNDPAILSVMINVLMISHGFGIMFALLALKLRYGGGWSKKIYLFRRPSLTHFILVLVALPALMGFVGVLESKLLPHIPDFESLGLPGLNQFMETLKKLSFTTAVIAIAVLPALNEELFCRGFLNSGLVTRYGALVSVLWVSFLFGILHLEPPQALFAMMLGVLIHLVYLASRSLPLAMFLHFANNFLVVCDTKDKLQDFFAPLKEQIKERPSLVFAASTLVLLVIGFFLYKTRIRAEQVA